jgi:hypothetical protein
MYQIKIIKSNGSAYGCAVTSLSAVLSLAELTAVREIILFAITPREYKHLQSLHLPKKIKITR